MPRIYTRQGDGGATTLYNKSNVQKTDTVFDALGDIDELNCKIGTVRCYLEKASVSFAAPDSSDSEDENIDPYDEMDAQLREIQSRLIDLASSVATLRTSVNDTSTRAQRTSFDDAHVTTIEMWIDALEIQLPKLSTFILPSGGLRACSFHEARVTCRRAERSVWEFNNQNDRSVEPAVLQYMNRLSDYLFTCARYCAKTDGYVEMPYRKRKRDAAFAGPLQKRARDGTNVGEQ